MDKTTITVIDYQQITMNKMALAGLIMGKNVIGYKYFVMKIITGLRFAIHLTDRHKKPRQAGVLQGASNGYCGKKSKV
ncbi:hypothetical protein [Cellvibrio sp. BR]|uniref:hypothetical protein n=1 Tax=Cellvibrio sp. BR TaxID=1134474 RepID=UPI00058EEE1B|nr:hypothetical protein [Cellvibrio sp. BR]